MSNPRSPRATYRLQLNASFDFAAARELVPYLRDLGISHLYLSPSLHARAGSSHGYDVIDPTRVSDELGGENGLRALAADAHDAGLGLVLDLVPNHMAVDEHNRFWTDPQLRERFFDIDPETGRHRRFFDIDDLAGVRQEDPEVFAATHELPLRLVGEGVIDGLRIDHPDGLADPAAYFQRLRDGGALQVWIEKILEPSERLRDWPVLGTVGYEFLNEVCALFVDGGAEPAFTNLWIRVSGDQRDFDAVAIDAKLEQAQTTFAPEIEWLARAVGGSRAIELALASMPVYRTYIDPQRGEVAQQDRAAIDRARMPGGIARRLLLEREAPTEFVTRFQQTSPPVVAKGVEDTAFYRYARLLALNEVGGDPGRFGITVDAFHAANAERGDRWPHSMLATCTHDTKRSADVRARIAALTWVADEWDERVRRWLSVTAPLVGARGAPDEQERYFLLQTLVGAWPIELERMREYMRKALREAKRNTSWVKQDTAWEDAVLDFCGRLYSHDEFRSSFDPFVERVMSLGERIGLGMLALKLTVPGIPDIYQGDELAFRALVDPDNRRPVDWGWYRAMLARMLGGARPDRHTAKLWLTIRLLSLRIRRPRAFAGAYQPLPAGDDGVAFLRGDEVLVIVALRAGPPAASLTGVEGTWRDVLRGELRELGSSVSLSGLLGRRGMTILERH
ncbi:MAG: malto-oligosyltrehalose synthase [Solirubrobacteraceae bacterium]